jgi:hypothetical protein
MKLGIIGLPQSGKSTVFEALTKSSPDVAHKGENRISTIRLPDNRIDKLSGMYQPQKTIYAQVEYFLPGIGNSPKKPGQRPESLGSDKRVRCLDSRYPQLWRGGFRKSQTL